MKLNKRTGVSRLWLDCPEIRLYRKLIQPSVLSPRPDYSISSNNTVNLPTYWTILLVQLLIKLQNALFRPKTSLVNHRKKLFICKPCSQGTARFYLAVVEKAFFLHTAAKWNPGVPFSPHSCEMKSWSAFFSTQLRDDILECLFLHTAVRWNLGVALERG